MAAVVPKMCLYGFDTQCLFGRRQGLNFSANKLVADFVAEYYICQVLRDATIDEVTIDPGSLKQLVWGRQAGMGWDGKDPEDETDWYSGVWYYGSCSIRSPGRVDFRQLSCLLMAHFVQE